MIEKKIKPVAVISAILQKKNGKGETLIFLQERWKPEISPNYSGMIEIPAGGIDSYEDVFDALKREIFEECGLKIKKIFNNCKSNIENPRRGDKAFIFQPFICQQVLETNNGLPWIGFVFVCEVSGKVKINTKEARNPQWVKKQELKKIIENSPETIFPLQLPVLKYYLKNFK
jgi:8-oxo-dGTP pyrophosphatase MutT (NUDIX family)